MKYIIYTMLFFSVCVFAEWDNVDQSTLDQIKANTSSMKSSLETVISENSNTNVRLYSIKNSNIEIRDILKDMNLGVTHVKENQRSELGNYRDFYNTVMNFNSNGFQLWDDTDFFNSYIKTYSNNNYDAIMSQTNQTAVPFIGKGQYFNYSDKMKLKLNDDGINETDSWFEVDVYNAQSGYSVKRLKTTVQNKLAEVQQVPENLPEQISDPNILFSFNLGSIFDLFVRLGLWQSNPIQNLIVPVKIIPSNEHDYLYSFYTWWNSNAFYPRMFRQCLKALIYLATFVYCYNYVVSTWNA